MVVIRLEGNEKEIYIKNLLMATNSLIKNIKNDDTLRKSEWDKLVYDEIIKALEKIYQLFNLLQRTTEEEDYNKNFGIYREIVLSNGGLPEFFSYRQLLDDKINAEEKIKQILLIEKIESKDDLVKIWIDKVNNLSSDDDERQFILDIIPDKYQEIEFYENIRKIDIFDIKNPMKQLNVSFIGDKNKERYILSWFNYVVGFGVWNIYIAQIEEKDPDKNLINHFINNTYEKGLFNIENKIIHINQEFKKFLEDHMSSGSFFLARDIDRIFSTLYPERISEFQFGPNFLKNMEKLDLKLDFSSIFDTNSFFLTATREDIESGGIIEGKKENYKCIWRTDKFTEQRFGICSKELEKPLKELIKFPNMRFYVT